MISVLACADPALGQAAAQRQAARGLLARALADTFALEAKELVFTTNGFGKPQLQRHPGVHLNVTHCPGAVAVVVADHRVGVDVEAIRPWDRYAGARMLQADELAEVAASAQPDRHFFRCWTLKEAYVKALGVGLGYPVRTLRVRPAPGGGATLEAPRAALRVHELLDGFVLATCSLRGGPGDAQPVVVRVGRPGEGRA